MVYLFCAYREYAIKIYNRLSRHYDVILLTDPNKLTYNYVKKINPKLIFFPDWSWIVPDKIIDNFKCICFHESNLPKFRGGSPIQNQIIRGIEKTKSTAFVMTKKLDGGEILLQKDLSLKGSLQYIFDRMIKNDYEIIVKIIKGQYRSKKQSGKPSLYKRRKPEESELKHLDYPKKYLYDFIRMLSDPYPNAFLRIGKGKIVFKSATYDGKKLEFRGEIM
jgi:methionyl-tRNA formyltransferase